MTYRVENMRALLPNFLKRMEIEPTQEVLDKCLEVPTNDHTRRKGHKVSSAYAELDFDKLMRENASIASLIRAQAQGYGYDF